MDERSYIFQLDTKYLKIRVYNEKIVRITYSADISNNKKSVMITAVPEDLPEDALSEERTDTECFIKTKYLTVAVDKATLNVKFLRSDGTLLSSASGHSLVEYDVFKTTSGKAFERETVDGVRVTIEGESKEFCRKSNHGKLKIKFSEDEALFGLGSHEEGYDSLKGHFVPLYQENMRIAIPYFVSTKGYAYLFDCYSLATFDATDPRYGKMWFDSLDHLDYYFIAGDGFDDVCRGYRMLTGDTPMLPKWAVGYVQSKERYKDQDELIQTASEYRRIGVPLDCIIQDWCTWPDGQWGYKHFRKDRYPDPKLLTDTLHGMNVRMMISIWPNMNGNSPDQLEFIEAGKMLADNSVYNAYDEDARKIYWRQANDALFKYGVDGWWCDSSEPYDAVWQGSERAPLYDRMQQSVNEFKKYIDDSVINTYSLHHSKGIYDGQRGTTNEKRVINLTRSGFSGQHRYGTVVWSGDISATWEALSKQVRIMQNYIACGEAYWNCDAGAFFVKQWKQWFGDGDYPAGKDDLGYRELYTRWLQFAGFTPFMRSHGTDTPREVWQFGERGTIFRDAIEKAIELRYQLAPYLYSLNAAVTFEGLMPVTSMALAYPNDRTARNVGWQYMYGHELLVCPVTYPMYYSAGSTEISGADRSVDVYLPEGGWYDFYTEEYFEGGRFIKVNCTIDNIPLFVRAGAIIPTSPVMQYVDEDPDAPCEVRIYGGADGEFVLYNDSGDGYDYENGDYTALKISYNDASDEITEELGGTEKYRRNIIYRKISSKKRD